VRLGNRRQRRGEVPPARHAFETLGCLRVEFKTDALNERARVALAALPAWYAVIDDDWPAVKKNLSRASTAR